MLSLSKYYCSCAQDYLSHAVPLVDTDRLEKDAAAESRARWKTPRGFVWPAAKKPGACAGAIGRDAVVGAKSRG